MTATAGQLLPLRPGDRATLVVDALGALPVAVASVGRGEGMLVLGRGAVPARILHGRFASLERTLGAQRFTGRGELVMVEHRSRVRDDVVVLRLGRPAPAGVRAAGGGGDPRRAFARTPAIVPVSLAPAQHPRAPAHALTLDLSAGGALVRTPSALDPGEELRVRLQLPGEPRAVAAAGAVVRRTPEGLLGVRLEGLCGADRALVETWIERRARRAQPR